MILALEKFNDCTKLMILCCQKLPEQLRSLGIFLKQKPGIGTIMNIIIIALVIDLTLNIFHPPSSIFLKYTLSIFSVLLVLFIATIL